MIHLRKSRPEAPRVFRIRRGLIFPILTIIVFGALGLLAALAIGSTVMIGLPLLITVAMMGLSALYVFLVIPRLRAAARERQATRRRRPQREKSGTEAG